MAYNRVHHIARCCDDLIDYIETGLPSGRGVYADSRASLIQCISKSRQFADTVSQYLGEYDTACPFTADKTLSLWNSQSDAMPPFKPKTPVSVTVEILTSDNKVVKAIYDARVSIWLSAEEWYKPEQVVGWRCLSGGRHESEHCEKTCRKCFAGLD